MPGLTTFWGEYKVPVGTVVADVINKLEVRWYEEEDHLLWPLLLTRISLDPRMKK